jgi:hypothetical protein
MKTIDFPQGSPEWFAARLGHVTASRAKDVMAKGRGGEPSATRAAYMGELISEILTGQPCNAFKGNADTERGQELEPAAKAAYELETGEIIRPVSLVLHPRIARAAASPDGLVGAGGLEIKCPKPHNHLDYLLAGVPPSVYIPQMAMQAACAELEFVEFVSFCPLMPPDLQVFIVRYVPTLAYLRELEDAVETFLAEMDAKLAKIAERRAA